MAFQKHTLKVPKDLHGGRLDEVLQEILPLELKRSVSKSFIRKLIMAGAVTLDQAPVRLPSRSLRGGVSLEVWVDPAALKETERVQAKDIELKADSILFEDDDIVVVNKPAGLPSQVTLDRTRNHLVAALTQLIQSRDGASAEVPG